ncbi:MAG TPA: adenosylcobinamide-GDP ribazoletransferase [Steroidobacteraceae bacterium]|jgi:adenosylcobinamide-GDP ribazoletransferase
MSLRTLRLAVQFLTRLPVRSVEDFSPAELSSAGVWFPVVGAIVGLIVALPLLLFVRFYDNVAGQILPAAVAVLLWVWVTGALHLDGLGDLADALAASHRDPKRFLEVLADPHLGTFGVVSIILAILLKTAAFYSVQVDAALGGTAWYALPLLAAWARLGPLAWSRWLPPLKAGHGANFGGPNSAKSERFAWNSGLAVILFWTAVLLAVSAWLAPVLCIAPIVLAAWGLWLHHRVGGMTGDCLGAGVEITEIALLLALSASRFHA